jgi:hypothetical protein
MRILAVTSWGGACGIANYAQMLIEAVGQADPSITFEPHADYLDPSSVTKWSQEHEILWLNYHRGLHSRWTPEEVQRMKQGSRKVVITFHDTYGERPPDELTQQLHDLADAFIVHEPCVGLPKQILIRQGVPVAQTLMLFEWVPDRPIPPMQDKPYMRVPVTLPILGTVGFNFPWKNFDRLAEVTAACGWAYLVCSNNATDADMARWSAANPWTYVLRGFQSTEMLVRWLGACDATCFAYECANSGTSGAIRLGLAARKPVITFAGCRQMRDLRLSDEHEGAIWWCGDWKGIERALRKMSIQRVDPGIVYLAHRDSWANQGRKYASIFRSCCP